MYRPRHRPMYRSMYRPMYRPMYRAMYRAMYCRMYRSTFSINGFGSGHGSLYLVSMSLNLIWQEDSVDGTRKISSQTFEIGSFSHHYCDPVHALGLSPERMHWIAASSPHMKTVLKTIPAWLECKVSFQTVRCRRFFQFTPWSKRFILSMFQAKSRNI